MAAVSVITPTYNRAHLLPRVWASLRRQTLADFQWIVVDDGSTDATRAVVASFADPRIRYVHQDNQGCNRARNRGEEEVEAAFVTYLDSDDELYADDSLARMRAILQAAGAEVGMAYFAVRDSRGRGDLCRIEGEQVVLDYVDRVCGRKASGEFMPMFRREVLALAPWPPYNGMESLRHWRLARARLAVFSSLPTRLYHRPNALYRRSGVDNLTGAAGAIRRAGDMARAHVELIAEHSAAWRSHCPCQLGRALFHCAMYQTLAERGVRRPLATLLSALANADRAIRAKSLLLLPTLLLPLALRRELFLWRARWRGPMS